jgi:hypothetical protein
MKFFVRCLNMILLKIYMADNSITIQLSPAGRSARPQIYMVLRIVRVARSCWYGVAVPSLRAQRAIVEEIGRREKVPRWVLECPECNQEFSHSEIDTSRKPFSLDPFAWIGDKPDFPGDGIRLRCPNCDKISVFKRYQLVYRVD